MRQLWTLTFTGAWLPLLEANATLGLLQESGDRVGGFLAV